MISAVSSIIPIAVLILCGVLARHIKLIKAGDEKVLNNYVYYFALPSMFVVSLAGSGMDSSAIKFMSAAALPTVLVIVLVLSFYRMFKADKGSAYYLVISSVFGSLAFFGIPFVLFAYPGEGTERTAVLAIASISIVSVITSVTLLEIYSAERKGTSPRLLSLSGRFAKNPLIISILAGLLLSLAGIVLPAEISTALHMLGVTTAPVALFMLGAFLYGKKYSGLAKAAAFSLTRVVLMPALALSVCIFAGITGVERDIIVLMNAMPTAVAMVVMSERYDFFRHETAMLILLTSVGSIVYLPLWLALLRAV